MAPRFELDAYLPDMADRMVIDPSGVIYAPHDKGVPGARKAFLLQMGIITHQQAARVAGDWVCFSHSHRADGAWCLCRPPGDPRISVFCHDLRTDERLIELVRNPEHGHQFSNLNVASLPARASSLPVQWSIEKISLDGRDHRELVYFQGERQNRYEAYLANIASDLLAMPIVNTYHA